LTERKGARLLSDGRGNLASVRSAAPPFWKVCLVGWRHPVSKTVTRLCRRGSTPLPSAQFTARSSSGRTAAPHAADAGSSPARVTIGRRRAPRSVLWAQGLRWTSHKESRHALPPGHDVIQCAPFWSSPVGRAGGRHPPSSGVRCPPPQPCDRGRGFRYPIATRDTLVRLQPVPPSHPAVAQWQRVSFTHVASAHE
jgi:hypothetical protein